MPVGKLLKSLISGEHLIKDVLDGIDQLSTSDQEREEAKALVLQKFKEYEEVLEQQLSARHQADMASDSWMSKNVRPMVLIYLLLVYTLLSIVDGNLLGFQINEGYIELLGQWGITVMSFYFSSRGIEKVSQVIASRKYRSP